VIDARGAVLCSLLALAGCGPGADRVEGVGFRLVPHDALLHCAIRVFQVYVIDGVSKQGSPVRCADLVGARFRPTDPALHFLVPLVNVAWTCPQVVEARAEHIAVPAERPVVFLVKGLAQFAKGTATIGSGCKDNQVFAAGAAGTVDIDVVATMGAPCAAQVDCELGLSCLQGAGFLGGYCVKSPCGSDADCTPASSCVADEAGLGRCMRACKAVADCAVAETQDAQDCVGRTSPQGSCARVCVFPLWNSANSCEP
jgi:hypothetical protein